MVSINKIMYFLNQMNIDIISAAFIYNNYPQMQRHYFWYLFPFLEFVIFLSKFLGKKKKFVCFLDGEKEGVVCLKEFSFEERKKKRNMVELSCFKIIRDKYQRYHF